MGLNFFSLYLLYYYLYILCNVNGCAILFFVYILKVSWYKNHAIFVLFPLLIPQVDLIWGNCSIVKSFSLASFKQPFVLTLDQRSFFLLLYQLGILSERQFATCEHPPEFGYSTKHPLKAKQSPTHKDVNDQCLDHNANPMIIWYCNIRKFKPESK